MIEFRRDGQLRSRVNYVTSAAEQGFGQSVVTMSKQVPAPQPFGARIPGDFACNGDYTPPEVWMQGVSHLNWEFRRIGGYESQRGR